MSDEATMRAVTRAALRYKEQRDEAIETLAKWANRYCEQVREFDDSEPGMADLLDETERRIYGQGQEAIRDQQPSGDIDRC